MKDQRGQATVELVLALPFLAFLLGALVELGILAADRTRVFHAAREGARVAAVDADEDAIARAARASGLPEVTVAVTPAPTERVQGEGVTVTVTTAHSGRIPVLRFFFQRVIHTASATMRIEKP